MCILHTLYCTLTSVIKIYICAMMYILCSFSTVSTWIIVVVTIIAVLFLRYVGIPAVTAVISYIWHNCKTKKGTLKYCGVNVNTYHNTLQTLATEIMLPAFSVPSPVRTLHCGHV